MKTLILTIFSVFIAALSIGQTVEKGMVHLNAGIGMPNNLRKLMKTIAAIDGNMKVKSSPVYQFSLDAAVGDEIQIGLLGGTTTVYLSERHESGYVSEQKTTSTIVGLKLEYITELGKKSMIYGGPTLIYSIINFKETLGYIDKIEGFGIYPHIGVTHMLSKNTSGYFELGYGMSLVNAGLKVRLK
jgi:hypothetical protein